MTKPTTYLLIATVSIVLGVGCSGGKDQTQQEAQLSAVKKGEITRAVIRGDLQKTQELIRAGANVNEDLGKEGNQVTPLLIAVVLNKPEIARLLVRSGASSSATHEGYSAKDLAYYLEQDQVASSMENR